MTVRNLEYAINPRSVAIIGASAREGSVGAMVLRNIIDGGFEGEIYPVNPKYPALSGKPCYPSIAALPEAPDFAVIVTPPKAVPEVVAELGERGCRAAVVITAGLTKANGLKQAMLDAAKPHLFRIIGPNTVGFILPPQKLNASFSHMPARPGRIALLSQSGAIVTSLIDWAADKEIGFSKIVSLGDMADVDVADMLDMLAGDTETSAIVMYLESIPHPRKFMSAARAAARVKPVIAIKPGRHAAAAAAAATHTGALSGADRVVDAALRRAGILRVKELDELFVATETVARFAPVARARTAIVTNGGGAGVLAVDRLMDWKGELAPISPETIAALDAQLPDNWSRANPLDIIGDAPPERYRAAVEAAAADPGSDVVLVMNCPTALASPVEAAREVAALAKKGAINGKPVLACWLGEHTAKEGRHLLQEAGIASYETPSKAADAIAYLSDWSRAQQQLMRVPKSIMEEHESAFQVVRDLLRLAAAEGRTMLTEPEAKAAIAAYGIAVPETAVATTPAEAGTIAASLLEKNARIAVKLMSRTLTHKSDVGGVVLNIATAEAARQACEGIRDRLSALGKEAEIDGYSVQAMVIRPKAHELILGTSRDPIFGPIMLFGAGGTAVEVMDDTAIGLPPIDDVLAGDLIDQTRIGRLLAGYRDRPPADRAGIIAALTALSRMLVDFPAIRGLDINPLLADQTGVIALDARIEIDPARVEEKGPNPDLAIRPYPSGWESDIDLTGHSYHIRPIQPSDVELYPDFLARVSPEDIRLRFLTPRKSFPDQMLKRLTQLDYDREIAFVALTKESGELAGIGRLNADPDHEVAEYALLVRTDLQGHGLGWALLKQLVDYAVKEGLRRIEGLILAENVRMLAMCEEFGFQIRPHPQDPTTRIATLDLKL
ncbi:bifunctional acetate--CoA ligase family protein/GNAT family N-acetyltransferase [Rhizobium alvei]|uniref:Bifunctional acetate--CoA ligase family protein/GNAT family N-acetyltransferase n=1 Tax=Rhizobium alvei TaxID=1132659 RepID=A0ABT8YH28_9HYPH|nr:bifunctional acetate--CoA ligase family protein/GNAT family N-acetyltransferase [Rhizobium alvei]MDO6962986.1 bifunctional acetate--CoA ligase family protein/GNAT family N-acetyltransferase [Rhizobium alvei]